MSHSEFSSGELTERIRERKELLTRIIDFVDAIVLERGKMMHRTQGSSNIHTIRQLIGFGDFSFLVDRGQTMMGGNSVKVWYHPDDETTPGLDGPPVLHVYFQVPRFNPDECKVKVFDTKIDWQSALNHTIEHQGEIAAQIDGERDVVASRRHEELVAQQRRAQLEEEARRLGL